jgi:hypothetical protein
MNILSNKKRKFQDAFENKNKDNINIKKFKHVEENESNEICKIKNSQNTLIIQELNIPDKDIFIDLQKFSSNICRCPQCQDLYIENKVEFLCDTNLVEEWENRQLMEDNLAKEAENCQEELPRVIEDEMQTFFNFPEVKKLSIEKVKLNFIFRKFMFNY